MRPTAPHSYIMQPYCQDSNHMWFSLKHIVSLNEELTAIKQHWSNYNKAQHIATRIQHQLLLINWQYGFNVHIIWILFKKIANGCYQSNVNRLDVNVFIEEIFVPFDASKTRFLQPNFRILFWRDIKII